MSNLFEKIYEESERQTYLRIIQSNLKKGKSIDEISTFLDIPVDFVEELIESTAAIHNKKDLHE